MTSKFIPIQYIDDKLLLLDQRKLPLEEIFLQYTTLEGGHDGIRDMVVRGAPCIGFTAIFSLALWLKDRQFQLSEFENACDYLNAARPTAVNLAYEIGQVKKIVKKAKENSEDAYSAVVNYGHEQIALSESQNRSMARFAEKDLDALLNKKKYNILTHCNTGFLACGSIGTALGVVQNLFEENKLEMTWVDETRPYLQGSRLTAYELSKLGAPHQVVVEGAASYLMSQGKVDAIFTGADRIAANGDTANKVGTSNLAIIAKHYGIPFYIVAPSSTFDMSLKSGDEIDIELRDPLEILEYKGLRIAPENSTAFNPSFDITRGELIEGIINENGIAKGNYISSLRDIIK